VIDALQAGDLLLAVVKAIEGRETLTIARVLSRGRAIVQLGTPMRF
jgi:hypothetical protein